MLDVLIVPDRKRSSHFKPCEPIENELLVCGRICPFKTTSSRVFKIPIYSIQYFYKPTLNTFTFTLDEFLILDSV